MKKFGIVVYWSFVLFFMISSTGLNASYLVELYKKKEIFLKEDVEFGKDNDWEDLFYDIYKSLVLGPEGNIYVINTHQHNIFQFSKDGKFLKKFGQKGQGPLDFFHPRYSTVLDDKFLVVPEYAQNRRLSVVNLKQIDPKHTRVLKTEHSVWETVALKKNKIAYLARDYVSLSKWEKKQVTNVIIKDVATSVEKVVASHELPIRCRSELIRIFLEIPEYFGKVFILSTKEGNLIVGYSDRPEINIISTDGKKLKTIKLDFPPLKVSEARGKEIIKKLAYGIRTSKQAHENLKNSLSGSKVFGDHFPYYTNLLVDSAGNILVFLNDVDCKDNCEIRFRVYSPEGRYICTTKINKGKFDFKIDYRFKNILFTEHGIYGLFQLKGTEDISLRLVRVKLGTK
jgi:hypothetical protein